LETLPRGKALARSNSPRTWQEWAGPSRRGAALVRDLGRHAVVDVLEQEAALLGVELQGLAPDVSALQPTKVITLLPTVFLIGSERILCCDHAAPPVLSRADD